MSLLLVTSFTPPLLGPQCVLILVTSRPAPRDLTPPLPVTPCPAGAQGGVSDALKAANKELVEKVRRQLGDDSFASFKAASVDFQRGAMPAPAYHAQMVSRFRVLNLKSGCESMRPVGQS
eukprot:366498-Chlamydomonas_euryale.AAC.12